MLVNFAFKMANVQNKILNFKSVRLQKRQEDKNTF